MRAAPNRGKLGRGSGGVNPFCIPGSRSCRASDRSLTTRSQRAGGLLRPGVRGDGIKCFGKAAARRSASAQRVAAPRSHGSRRRRCFSEVFAISSMWTLGRRQEATVTVVT